MSLRSICFSAACGLFFVINCVSCTSNHQSKGVPSDNAKIIVEDCDTSEVNSLNDNPAQLIRTIYVGNLPSASGSGIKYKLTIFNMEHSGDGTFTLTLDYNEPYGGKDSSFKYSGKRFTQRGIPADDNATVWQCVNDGDNERFNFLVINDSTLLLLNSKFEIPQSRLDYRLYRQSTQYLMNACGTL